MTTLNVNTIQDTSGSNSSTPAEIVNGRAKAWVSYDGSTNNVRSSYNVSSVTDNATGDFTVNFDNNLSSANYSYTGNVMSNSTAVVPRGIQLHRTTNYTAATLIPCSGRLFCLNTPLPGYNGSTPESISHTAVTAPTSSSIRLQVTDAVYNGATGSTGAAIDAQYVNFVAYE